MPVSSRPIRPIHIENAALLHLLVAVDAFLFAVVASVTVGTMSLVLSIVSAVAIAASMRVGRNGTAGYGSGCTCTSILPFGSYPCPLFLPASFLLSVVAVGGALPFASKPLEVGCHGIFQIALLVVVCARGGCSCAGTAELELGWRSIEALGIGVYPVSLLIGDLGLLVARDMVYPQRLSQHLRSVEVVHCKHGRPLVLIHQKPKSSMLSLAHRLRL